MKIIEGRNVNDIYRLGRELLNNEGELQRNERTGMDVLVAPWPVTAVYDKPTERVLFDPVRDANVFFHLYESIWMLAGGRDATCLDQFVKGFSARYTEPHGGVHGAYGHRWRRHFDHDQLKTVINRLRRDPLDRRVVLGMWDSSYDSWDPARHEPEDGEYREPLDLPCNLVVLPRIVNGALDITTLARSHDQIWGASGANAVHFTILQEYIAAGIGVPVGKFYQISNNFHLYTDIAVKKPRSTENTNYYLPGHPNQIVEPTSLVTDFQAFDQDCYIFMEGDCCAPGKVYDNLWFLEVAVPMMRSHQLWKEGRKQYAYDSLTLVRASDWRLACQQWMQRRMEKKS